MYATAGLEEHTGQHLSIPGRQSSLYEWIPIRKFPQLGPYAGPYCAKAKDHMSQTIKEAQEASPTLFQAISLVVFHPDAPSFAHSVLPTD